MIPRFLGRSRLAKASAVTLLLLYLGAALAPWIAPYDPRAVDLDQIFAPPSPAHWLGTDEAGRDQWSRLLHGGRVSLTVGLVAAGVGTGLGVLIGLLAGYVGGWLDAFLMRLADLLLSLPTLFLLLAAAAFLRPGLAGIMGIVGATSWMGIARLVRAEAQRLRAVEYVEAARALGAGDTWILRRHVLPNAWPPVLVAGTLMVGGAILVESTLSFLGLGVQPPRASWGSLLANAQEYLWRAPWLAIPPGALIALTMLAIAFLGDALREGLDPRRERRGGGG